MDSEDKLNEISENIEDNILLCEGNYSLNKSEAFEGLKNSGIIKTIGNRTYLYTAILAVAIIGFLYAYFLQGNFYNMVFAIISVIVLAIICIVPSIYIDKLAKLNVNNNIINFKIYSNKIHILCNDSDSIIKLDKTNKFKLCKNVAIIKRTDDDQLFIIPIRAFDENDKDRAIDVLENGTLNL